jgi:hypothetical protein
MNIVLGILGLIATILLAIKEEINYRIYLYGVIGGAIISFFITITVIDMQLEKIINNYREHVTELHDIIDNQLEQQLKYIEYENKRVD